MLTGTFIFFEADRRYSVLTGVTNSLLDIIQENPHLMQNSVIKKAEEANSGEKD